MGINSPIHMNINGTPFRKQFFHQYQSLIHHLQETLQPPAPGIAVGFFFDNGVFFVQSFAAFAHRDIHCKIGAGGKGRVNVNQVDLAGKVFQQAAHHHLIIAPDQLVVPAFFKGFAFLTFIVIKKVQLYITSSPFHTWFVHHLHNLKGIRARFFHRL